MLVYEAVATGLANLGVDTVFGVVGSGNFHVTNALVAGVPAMCPPGTSAVLPAWPTPGPGAPAAPAW